MSSYSNQLNAYQKFFNNSCKAFSEDDSGYRPSDDVYTVSQQIAHVAMTIDWFFEPLSSDNNFDMNFEAHHNEVLKVTSLKEALIWFNNSFNRLIDFVSSQEDAYFDQLLPDNMIMGPSPKSAIIYGIIDHTAHHRGSLAVYARQQGKVPPMPYME